MTAQNVLNAEETTPSACGTACGASDETQKPAACGTACGAGE